MDIYPTLFPKDSYAIFVSKYLYEYFLERQQRFKEDYNKKDYISMWDIIEDPKFEFSYRNITGLI